MRIVGGKHRGRPLRASGGTVRPTADRVRESVFNILAHGPDWAGFDGNTVLDVFAGSGALGLESLSRGARRATFVDWDRAALDGIRRNAAALGEARAITLLKLDATRLPPPPRLAETPAALAFLDPPYESGLAAPALGGLAARGWLAEGGLAVVEVAAREGLDAPPGYAVLDERTYGAARIVFLKLRGSVTSEGRAGRP